MLIKSSHRSFKPLATAGTGTLLAALLSACGGGPMENANYQNTLASGNINGSNAGSNNGEGKKYLTYEEWKAEEAKSEEARKKAEEEARKQSEAEQKRQEEAAKRELEKLILASANEYEQEQFDKTDANTPGLEGKLDENGNPIKKPVYLVVGLDDETRWADQLDKWGHTAKFVSLHGHNLYSYYKNNCPVTEGLDPEREQGDDKVLRNTYRCMADIYVGRTESGKMCYTFFDRNGKISHVNDNTAVYPFRPGILTESPYGGYLQDSKLKVTYDPATGYFTFSKKVEQTDPNAEEKWDPVQTVNATIPVFSRLDVGGNMFMMLNAMRRYPNPLGVTQKLDVAQMFRTQQAVFKFNSSAQTIDIFQYNTDEAFGTGSLEDTCYVNFRGGLKKEEEAKPDTSTSNSGS